MYCVPIYLLILKIWRKRFVRGREMEKYVTIIIYLPKLTKKIYNFFVMSLPYIDTKRNKKRIFCNEMKKKQDFKGLLNVKGCEITILQDCGCLTSE